MKQRSALAATFFASLFCAVVLLAQLKPDDWAWRAPITAPQGAGGMTALPLDGAIYDRLLAPPHDLRLVRQDGTLVPHVVQCGRTAAATAVVDRPVQIINRTYKPKRFSRAVLDFGESLIKNTLKVDLPGRNYRRRATLEGGVDGQTWEMVAENLFLSDIQTARESYRVDTLAFPANDFRYLRLTVENMPDDPERIEIDRVRAFYEEPAGDAQLTRVEIVSRSIERDKNNSTLITLDLGFRHLPLQNVMLAIDDPFFHRTYTVEGRNTTRHKIYRRAEEVWRAEERDTPWSSVSHGIFFRRRDQGKLSEMTEAVISHAAYRYLRITIKNNDDRPLDIRDVAVSRRTCALLFEAQSGSPFTLYGGNGKAGAPSYDLARLVPGIDIATLPEANRGAIEPLSPEAPPVPWSERYWYVVTAGVIVAVALMLWIILPVMKKQTGSSG